MLNMYGYFSHEDEWEAKKFKCEDQMNVYVGAFKQDHGKCHPLLTMMQVDFNCTLEWQRLSL